MVYSYDHAILFPVKDLYDNQIMLASILAAKDMYNKREKMLDDFYKTYKDFYTPIAEDLRWFQDNVVGKIQNGLDYLYNNGIDPLRSPEGGALLLRLINSIDTGRHAKNIASAKNAQQEMDEYRRAAATDWFDPSFYQFTTGSLPGYDTWDSQNGIYQARPIYQKKSLGDLGKDALSKVETRLLNKKQVEDILGPGSYDNLNDYYGKPLDDLEAAARDAIVQNLQDPSLQYYIKTVQNRLAEQLGTVPTQDEILNQLAKEMAGQAAGIQQTKENRRTAAALDLRNALALLRDRIRQSNNNRTRSGGGGGGSDQYGWKLIDELKEKPESYIPADGNLYYQQLDPVGPAYIGKTDEGYHYVRFTGAGGVLLKLDENGQIKHNSTHRVTHKDKMFAVVGDGNYIYHSDNGKDYHPYLLVEDNGNQYLLQMKERRGNYGNPQKNKLTGDRIK